MSPKEIEEKRANNICFFCNEKFHPGHKCKAQVYRLEIMEDSDDEEFKEEERLEGEQEKLEEETPQISLQALAGINTYQTMRLVGRIGKHTLQNLVDSGSTHNFLDMDVARRLHCQLNRIPQMLVTVVDGNKLTSDAVCKGFTWRLHGEEYKADMIVVALASCEMILGVQWLTTLGPILWDFEKLRMEFKYNGKKQVLRGSNKTTVEWMECKGLKREIIRGAQIFTVQVQPVTQPFPTSEDINPIFSELLTEYSNIFEQPKQLPPHRFHDHKIILKKGTHPVNVRPYRYLALQKDIIEKIIGEMLEAGVVRPSQSPYSSPIVLVKKKDGSWRLCVDYRQLNKHTVTDKFPIPVIEELLDELHGAEFFSKMDLRSGYWQVRLNPADIAKTAFRTHEGRYEFVVMPFGLTNAPSTFQALMNHVFKQYLRKFILVFFDDILIYSRTQQQHFTHLKLTLETLR